MGWYLVLVLGHGHSFLVEPPTIALVEAVSRTLFHIDFTFEFVTDDKVRLPVLPAVQLLGTALRVWSFRTPPRGAGRCWYGGRVAPPSKDGLD